MCHTDILLLNTSLTVETLPKSWLLHAGHVPSASSPAQGPETPTSHPAAPLFSLQQASVFTNPCFSVQTSLVMDHPSLTRVPTESDVLITAERLHRAASNFWLRWLLSQGVKFAMMLILLNVLDELMYLMGNKEELKLNRTFIEFKKN